MFSKHQSIPVLPQLKKNYSSSAYFGHSSSYIFDIFDNDKGEEDLYDEILGHRNSSGNIIDIKSQNATKFVLEREAYCFDMKFFAEKFVEAIFIEAKKALMKNEEILTSSDTSPSRYDVNDSNLLNDPRETSEKFSNGFQSSDSSASYWPKISEFNIKIGLQKIENYVKLWKRSDAWEFCIEFLGFECEDCSNIFVYEVEWSKPTMSYPIPQATASVFFALEVYKMVPPNYDRSVEVTYIFECSSVIHHPGNINFQEKWLEDIIEAKIKFFKTITFSVPKGVCDTSSPQIPV